MSEPAGFKQWLSGIIVVALLVAVGVIAAAWVGREASNPTPPVARPRPKLGVENRDEPDGPVVAQDIDLELEEVLEQPVNMYGWDFGDHPPNLPEDLLRHLKEGKEQGTFRFVITNRTESDIKSLDAEILIDYVPAFDLGSYGTTRVLPFKIFHDGHKLVTVSNPLKGDVIPVSNVIEKLAPGQSRELILWFHSDDAPIVVFDARLRVYFGEQAVTSEPFRVEIHKASFTYPPSPFSPGFDTSADSTSRPLELNAD